MTLYLPLPHWRRSLVGRAFWIWMLILLLVLTSMTMSLYITQTTEGDAERINVSGSLRMQSYLISQYLLRLNDAPKVSATEFVGQLDEFERRMTTEVLSELLQKPPLNPQRLALEKVHAGWRHLREQLVEATDISELPQRGVLLTEIDSFVNHIDAMVRLFQKSTEKKMATLRWIHGMSITLLVLIAGFALINLYRTVVRPIDYLATAAEKVRNGNLKARVELDQEDELGTLARAFNKMSTELDLIYQDLETRVALKTHKLSEQTKSLELLYETARLINAEENHATALLAIMQRLSDAIEEGTFSLMLTEQATPFTSAGDWYQKVAVSALREIQGKEMQQITPSVWRFPIADARHLYGCLEWAVDPGMQTLEKRQLIVAVSGHIASAFSRDWKNEQTYRLLLVEERATIARELHDSLAQALSFLKMQVAKWQTLSERGADAAELAKITGNIRNAINTAYAQLRELLVTFRLKLDEPGLHAALKATAAEYRERGSMEIDLDYRLEKPLIGANAEIHLLQIVREALANVVRHARASKVTVLFDILPSEQLLVEITDDGVGLQAGIGGLMHHGMSIMRERAQSLGATLQVENGVSRGVVVRLVCNLDALNRHGESAGSSV
ncbi:MAG: HAMP domain-containing protein [Hahellaceae bacterium]|nr:HAMP domain-containing protein [Hahellaceae bacterium]MCP5168307.1 HAMP domain-containing protein [Hahellaceae bacterium]